MRIPIAILSVSTSGAKKEFLAQCAGFVSLMRSYIHSAKDPGVQLFYDELFKHWDVRLRKTKSSKDLSQSSASEPEVIDLVDPDDETEEERDLSMILEVKVKEDPYLCLEDEDPYGFLESEHAREEAQSEVEPAIADMQHAVKIEAEQHPVKIEAEHGQGGALSGDAMEGVEAKDNAMPRDRDQPEAPIPPVAPKLKELKALLPPEDVDARIRWVKYLASKLIFYFHIYKHLPLDASTSHWALEFPTKLSLALFTMYFSLPSPLFCEAHRLERY